MSDVAKNENEFAFLDDIMADLDQVTSRTNSNGPRLQYLYLGNHKFKARILMDSKQKIQNNSWMYEQWITKKDDQGKDIKNCIKYVPPTEMNDDPLRSIAKELHEYKYTSSCYYLIFAYITEITEGGTDKFKPNMPTLIICRNDRLLGALKLFLSSEIPPHEVANLLNCKKSYKPFTITSVKGQNGTCDMTLESFSKEVDVPEEFQGLYGDITEHYIPKIDTNENKNLNDLEGQKLLKIYNEMLINAGEYIDPTVPETSPLTETGTGPSTETEPPKEESGPSANDILNSALNAAENKS